MMLDYENLRKPPSVGASAASGREAVVARDVHRGSRGDGRGFHLDRWAVETDRRTDRTRRLELQAGIGTTAPLVEVGPAAIGRTLEQGTARRGTSDRCLPAYAPELDPVEQCWNQAKCTA